MVFTRTGLAAFFFCTTVSLTLLLGGCPTNPTDSGQDSPTAGATGPAGPQGPEGPAGATGPAGPQGAQGLPGQPGAQGLPGAPGAQGLQGVAGDDGADGAAGATGAQGSAGPTGADGAAGPQGPAGPSGPSGPQGPIGPQGPSDLLFWGRFDGIDGGAGDPFRALEVGGSSTINSVVHLGVGEYLVVLNASQADFGVVGISVTTSTFVPSNVVGVFANASQVTDHPSGLVAISVRTWYMTNNPPLNLITAVPGDTDFTLTALDAAAP